MHLQCRRPGLNPWVGKIPWRRALQSTQVFLPGESHGQRTLAGYSLWGCKELDTTKVTLQQQQAALWASQVAVVVKYLPTNAGDIRDMGSIPGLGRSPGGGQGNPLQYSCRENLIDRGAWRAIVHRVEKSQTGLVTACTQAALP